jgi:hypothetical protein
MRRGGRDYWGYRGGKAYRGQGDDSITDNKLEPVNRLNENYSDEPDDSQDPWDPGLEYHEWEIDTDDDDTLK